MEIFCNASTLVSDWMQTEFVDENVMLVMFCSPQRCVFMEEGKRERWRLFPQQFSPLLSRYHPPSPDSPRRAAGFSRRSTIIAVYYSGRSQAIKYQGGQIIYLPGRQIDSPLMGRQFFLPFLSATPHRGPLKVFYRLPLGKSLLARD